MSNGAPTSICILRLSAIGNCCHVVALVQHIQKHLPNARITWVIGSVEEKLLAALLPDVEFIVFDKKQGWSAYKKLRAQMQGRRFDALLNLQANMRANAISLFIPARKKIGFARERARELQWLFTNAKAPLGKGIHVAEGFMDFAPAIGLPAATPSWDISAPKQDLAWAQQHLDKRPLFIICPAGSKPAKNWTPEGYAAAAKFAHEKGMKVMLVGGPTDIEFELGDNIVQLAPFIDENLIGKTTLPQLLALIESAALLLAPDTGPAHMGTLVGTPVIGLYATHNPQRTGPYNDLDKVVSVYEKLLFEETGKRPDEVSWRTRIKAEDAAEQISIENVLNFFDPSKNKEYYFVFKKGNLKENA